MANRENLEAPVNAPQPVTWFLANYYPTNADGQTASVVGVQFSTYEAAVSYGRTKLETEGVGVVYIQRVEGNVMFPLYVPEAN